MKMFLLCVSTFVVTCFLYLCYQTRSPLSDVFTTGRVSLLKDRPENITKDIIVDMSNISAYGGVWTLTEAIISDIVKRRPNWRLIVLVQKDSLFKVPRGTNVKIIETSSRSLPFSISNVLSGTLYDKLIQLLYYDRIFCDKYCDLVWDPAGDSSDCNFVNIPRISTIHDLVWFDLPPKYFEKDTYWKLAKIHVNNTIRFSKKIITVSKFSQQRICDRFHVSRNFVHEVPIRLGARIFLDNNPFRRIEVLNKYNVQSQKYFIFCAGWWRNKNHIALMTAFNEFAKKNTDIKLILVGQPPKFINGKPIESYQTDRLIISGFVPDDELAILLKNALAFVHPSVYEGFGMPIIEAMANGIPVACSNVASLPEVAGNAALLFDPFNINSIVEAMQKLADNPQLRAELIQKGYIQAKKYENRDEMVDEYIRVMEEVMESKK